VSEDRVSSKRGEGGQVMRVIPAAVAAAMTLAGVAASAQGVYYAERGHWTVTTGMGKCIALNRVI